TAVVDGGGPRGRALAMAWRQSRDQHGAAQLDAIAVGDDTVDRTGRPGVAIAVGPLALAAGGDHRGVLRRGQYARAGQAPHQRVPLDVIDVRVAGEQDLDVRDPEAERLDAALERRHVGLEAAVEQDVPARRGDQEDAHVPGAHEVHVAGDAER